MVQTNNRQGHSITDKIKKRFLSQNKHHSMDILYFREVGKSLSKTVSTYDVCCRGRAVIVPLSFHTGALQEVHSGHSGITAVMQLAIHSKFETEQPVLPHFSLSVPHGMYHVPLGFHMNIWRQSLLLSQKLTVNCVCGFAVVLCACCYDAFYMTKGVCTFCASLNFSQNK